MKIQLVLIAILLSTLGLVARAAPLAHTCNPGNGGITLPKGFCATVFADNLGTARQLVVNSNGDVYMALLSPAHGGGIAALRPGANGRAPKSSTSESTAAPARRPANAGNTPSPSWPFPATGHLKH